MFYVLYVVLAMFIIVGFFSLWVLHCNNKTYRTRKDMLEFVFSPLYAHDRVEFAKIYDGFGKVTYDKHLAYVSLLKEPPYPEEFLRKFELWRGEQKL